MRTKGIFFLGLQGGGASIPPPESTILVEELMDLVSKDRNYIQLEIQERAKGIFFLGLQGGRASIPP